MVATWSALGIISVKCPLSSFSSYKESIRKQFAKAFSDIDCLGCGTAGNARAVPQPDSLFLVVGFLSIEFLLGDRRPRPGVLLQGAAKVTVRIRFDPEQLAAIRLVDADELTYG